MPAAQTLVDLIPPHKSYLMDGVDVAIVNFFDGDSQKIWDDSHPSYEGMRIIALEVKDLDDEQYEILFFDHEDGTYTFAGTTL